MNLPGWESAAVVEWQIKKGLNTMHGIVIFIPINKKGTLKLTVLQQDV